MPLRLGANQPLRFYRGGDAIARFRREAPRGEFVPEDWVGSTTSLLDSAPHGLTVLPDGRTLANAVVANSDAFLGPEHVASFGADPAVLVKLLDAGERLPVHYHPDRAFAREHLASRYGKTECWLIVAAEGDDAVLHLGFRDDVDVETVSDWVARQDSAAMLGAMNELRVARGDCVYVPAGTPHAIGKGIFMVEIQEPSDLGVMLESTRFGIDADAATMGLGLELALGACRLDAVTRDDLAPWICRSGEAPELRPGARTVVPGEAAPFFRAEWLQPQPATELEPGWSILVVLDGEGALATESVELELAAGDTVLVPHAAGAAELLGPLEAVRCLPPRPEEVR